MKTLSFLMTTFFFLHDREDTISSGNAPMNNRLLLLGARTIAANLTHSSMHTLSKSSVAGYIPSIISPARIAARISNENTVSIVLEQSYWPAPSRVSSSVMSGNRPIHSPRSREWHGRDQLHFLERFDFRDQHADDLRVSLFFSLSLSLSLV